MLANEGIIAEATTRVESNPVASEIDKAFPKAKLQDFETPRAHGEKINIAVDTQIRNVLASGEFSKEVGTEIYRAIYSTANQFEKMRGALEKQVSENRLDRASADKRYTAERELYAISERLAVERIWKGDTERKMALANQLLGEMEAKNPGLIEYLQRNGASNSSAVVIQLGEHAARLQMKAEARGKK